MTDTPDWKPSERMVRVADAAGTLSSHCPADYEIALALIAVRPLIIAEAMPQIEAAERERVLTKAEALARDWGKHILADDISALKDSKP